MNQTEAKTRRPQAPARLAVHPPLAGFLADCHATFSAETSGAIADYIPELTKADPAHFGISLATIDGYVYEFGDSAVPFTIQSISKAFVFALALDMLGADRVEAAIGVEPSGEAFNSIRLTADNRPFNPMVNAGAIACSGLIYEAEGTGSFECIRNALSRFAGRNLDIDEAVFASEQATGDRNRAIAYMLRNYAVIKDDVDAVLEVYFRQCSVMVTARDLAVMAATLANRGANPVTGETIVEPYAVARTLSVMISSGMYDYAGEWTYRVGIPAKSGVGGGIVAALPAQLGLGTYSPLLDSHGNSVRGLKVCEALSAHFDLHVLNRSGDVRTCIIADYDIAGISSRRSRQPHEQHILDERYEAIRIVELVGALNFASVDYVSRQIVSASASQFLVLDFRRVPALTRAAARLLAETLGALSAAHVTAILSGMERTSSTWDSISAWTSGIPNVRDFPLLDDAIEWAEDQVIYRYGGYVRLRETMELSEQALLTGLTSGEIDALASLGTRRTYQTGQRIISAGDSASSLFFLLSGMVSVKLPSGVRLATLVAGMEFGEMALIEERRTADVWADTLVECLEVPLEEFHRFGEQYPQVSERIVRNLAALLAKRLIMANTKVDLLSAY